MAAAIKKRLRVFAGPNGSGKSTITNIVLDYAHLGTYVNAVLSDYVPKWFETYFIDKAEC